MSATAIKDYCPTCGSTVDEDGECGACAVERSSAHVEPAIPGLRSCRYCGSRIEKPATSCPVCGTENPTYPLGIAPVAQFVLGLVVLAVALGVFGLIFGPIVP